MLFMGNSFIGRETRDVLVEGYVTASLGNIVSLKAGAKKSL
jgi:hypothetical protein